jgi:hypothetical protein
MEIDEALSHFFSAFQLPPSSAQIDHILEAFAERFFKDNPSTVCGLSSEIYTFSSKNFTYLHLLFDINQKKMFTWSSY